MYIVKYWQAKRPVGIVIALQMYCNTNIYKVSSDQSNRKIRPYLHTCMHRFKVTSLLIGVLLITTNEKCFIWLIVRFYSTLNINTWTPTHWHTHRNLISEWHIPPATISATEWKWRCSILTFLTESVASYERFTCTAAMATFHNSMSIAVTFIFLFFTFIKK